MLFTDWTILRFFAPLRSRWARIGTQAKVPITGQNAKRGLFGALNVATAHRTVFITRSAGSISVRSFLSALRHRYRRAGTIFLLADRASGHTAAATLVLARSLDIFFVWLPKQWLELNAMDQLWRTLKQHVAANRQADSIDELAAQAARCPLRLTSSEARRLSGMNARGFCFDPCFNTFGYLL